jgi:hypothetical protein
MGYAHCLGCGEILSISGRKASAVGPSVRYRTLQKLLEVIKAFSHLAHHDTCGSFAHLSVSLEYGHKGMAKLIEQCWRPSY